MGGTTMDDMVKPPLGKLSGSIAMDWRCRRAAPAATMKFENFVWPKIGDAGEPRAAKRSCGHADYR
jgi:hypothetical protein